jgi:hypothetical protein
MDYNMGHNKSSWPMLLRVVADTVVADMDAHRVLSPLRQNRRSQEVESGGLRGRKKGGAPALTHQLSGLGSCNFLLRHRNDFVVVKTCDWLTLNSTHKLYPLNILECAY